MTYRVVDADGKTLASGNELHLLQEQFSGQAQQQFVKSSDTAGTFTGCRDWQFGDIPEEQSIEQAGIRMTGYPALVDEGETVGLKVLDSDATAQRSHLQGLLRLLKLQLPQEVRYLKKNLPNLDKMRLQYAKVPTIPGIKPKESDLQDVLVDWILVKVFLDDAKQIRTEEHFQQCMDIGKSRLMTVANDSCDKLGQVLMLYQQLRKAISQVKQINWMASLADMKQQLDDLVFQGFLQGMTEQRFKDYLRYLKAMQMRLDKLVHAAPRDQKLMREMADIQSRLIERQSVLRQKSRLDERVDEIRWMIEELRISLFAQEIKTAYPISVKRIEKRWKELGL